MTVESIRKAQAARARRRRVANGDTRSTLIELAALGRFLRTLDAGRALFAVEIGDDVARRALWAAEHVARDQLRNPLPDDTELERSATG